MNILKVIIGLAFACCSTISFAEIKSISNEVEIVKDGLSYTDLTVTCTTVPSKRLVRRNSTNGGWCDTRILEMCSSTKVGIAQKVCGYRIASSAVRSNSQITTVTQNVDSTITNSDQITTNRSIEEQQILIDQRKLELRKRELELSKRRLALEGLKK